MGQTVSVGTATMLGEIEHALEPLGLELVESIPTLHSSVVAGRSVDWQPYFRLSPLGCNDVMG